MMMWRIALVLAALAAAAPAQAGTPATLAVTSVDRSHPGIVRIAVRYDGSPRPTFRVTPGCGGPGERMVAAAVTVAPATKQALIELPDDLGWRTDRPLPCQERGLAVQMLDGTRVVASAEVPVDIPAPRALTAAPPPPPAPLVPSLGVEGRKLRSPQTKMSEAGLTWSVSDHVTLNLTYERTAYAPTMLHDHDDGILTGVKVGF
jgi:hypothetical protein